MLRDNKLCEEMIETKLKVPILDAELETFSKCCVIKPMLEAFIHCRLFNTLNVPRNFIWKDEKYKKVNKGQLAPSRAGEDNLITRAMEVKDRPVLLTAPVDEDNDLNNSLVTSVTIIDTETYDVIQQLTAR